MTAVAARGDGGQIASSSEDGAIRIWDLHATDAHRALADATDSLWAVAFSPDGKRVAAAGSDRMIRIYDPESGKLEATLKGAKSPITSLAFFPDCNRLVAAGGDRVVVVWDVGQQTESPALQALIAPSTVARVCSVAYRQRQHPSRLMLAADWIAGRFPTHGRH